MRRAMASLNKLRGLRMVVGDDDPVIAVRLRGLWNGQGSGDQVMSSEGVNKPKPWLGNNALQETHGARVVMPQHNGEANSRF